jgi:large subunit ribosomal protein L9
MQVILLEKVVNLGNLGDIVKVKDGFGRNFLIPQGKAKRATEANKAEFEARRADIEKAQAAILAAAQARGEQLASFNVEVAQKAGVDGRLFGSVSNADIAEAITAKGVEVAKSEVRLPDGALKTTGDHPVKVTLHHDVSVDITVTIVGEE